MGRKERRQGKGLRCFFECSIYKLVEMQESIFLSKYLFWLKKPKNLVLGMLFLTLLHLINKDFGRKRGISFPLTQTIEYCLIKLMALL